MVKIKSTLKGQKYIFNGNIYIFKTDTSENYKIKI